jgi:hypothetical protein
VLLPGPRQLVTRRIAARTEVLGLEHDGHFVQGWSAIVDYVADQFVLRLRVLAARFLRRRIPGGREGGAPTVARAEASTRD